MSMTDPISDLLTRIRNAQAVEKASVMMPASKVKRSILKVLKDEGYIEDFCRPDRGRQGCMLNVRLKYYAGRPVIERIERFSTPGAAQIPRQGQAAEGVGRSGHGHRIDLPRGHDRPRRTQGRVWAVKCCSSWPDVTETGLETVSRIAKYPVTVPSGVEVKLNDGLLSIKGPKGRLEVNVHPKVKLSHEGQLINVATNDDSTFADAMSGTTRALVNNMVLGVTKGFEKRMTIIGVGYRAAVQGKI